MTNGSRAAGFDIMGVRLREAGVLFEDESKVRRQIADAGIGEPRLRIAQLNRVLPPKVVDGDPSVLLIELMVEVQGIVAVGAVGTDHDQVVASAVKVWRVVVRYQGAFRVREGSEVSREDVATIHGPAHLYAYAREFVSDATRRAMLEDVVYLPPWNFAASDDSKIRGGEPQSG